MGNPTPKERIEHILMAIRLIREFVSGMNQKSFSRDVKVQSAVQYQFLIIGEAIRHIDDDLLAKYDYPWHIPRSFRNFIIHVYHGIKVERIYYATQDLNVLEKHMQSILENEFRS
jgi:uncharacterized protein with HEPN domain